MWFWKIFRLWKLQMWKKLIDKLVEECSENIDENEMIYNATLNDHRKVCNSWTKYIILFVIIFIIGISNSSVFTYLYWFLILILLLILTLKLQQQFIRHINWKYQTN